MEATCKLLGGAIQSRGSEIEERLRIRHPGEQITEKKKQQQQQQTWRFLASSIFSKPVPLTSPPPKKNVAPYSTKPCPPPALKGDFPNVEFHPRSPDLPPQSWWKLKSWYSDNNKTWVIWAQLKMEFTNLSHPKPSSAGTCQWKEPFVACHPRITQLAGYPSKETTKKMTTKKENPTQPENGTISHSSWIHSMSRIHSSWKG